MRSHREVTSRRRTACLRSVWALLIGALMMISLRCRTLPCAPLLSPLFSPPVLWRQPRPSDLHSAQIRRSDDLDNARAKINAFWHKRLQCKSYQRPTLSGGRQNHHSPASAPTMSAPPLSRPSAAVCGSAQGLQRHVALHLHRLGQALCHKLKNGSFNDADWFSLLPHNLL